MNKYIQLLLAVLIMCIGVCYYIIWPNLWMTFWTTIFSVIGIFLIIGGGIWAYFATDIWR